MEMGEVGYFWMRWRRYFGGSLEKIFVEVEIFLVEENGRMEKVGEFGGRKRKERKRKKKKKLEKGRYFLGRKSENNDSGGFPGFSCGCGKHSEKIPESSENQVSRNDPQ